MGTPALGGPTRSSTRQLHYCTAVFPVDEPVGIPEWALYKGRQPSPLQSEPPPSPRTDPDAELPFPEGYNNIHEWESDEVPVSGATYAPVLYANELKNLRSEFPKTLLQAFKGVPGSRPMLQEQQQRQQLQAQQLVLPQQRLQLQQQPAQQLHPDKQGFPHDHSLLEAMPPQLNVLQAQHLGILPQHMQGDSRVY
ncbi:uncharacterized protein LOC142814425 [Rhipicephalus microplus]|uniref:uncharacterized protein LOC142814425 n=1 Tax=Rhipicephalus microplus TaxID=6941 RepID=UPI003F6C362D